MLAQCKDSMLPIRVSNYYEMLLPYFSFIRSLLFVSEALLPLERPGHW